MCAQLRSEDPYLGPAQGVLPPDALGLPPHETQIGLQTDVVRELVNKVAWVLGSVYRQSYSNMRTPARTYAWRIVKQVIKDHGYPAKIGK